MQARRQKPDARIREIVNEDAAVRQILMLTR